MKQELSKKQPLRRIYLGADLWFLEIGESSFSRGYREKTSSLFWFHFKIFGGFSGFIM
jgi:hypothetical protein